MSAARFIRFVSVGLIVSTFAAGLPAHASVVIASTRVVYNQKDPEVTLKLTNNGNSPSLTQVWLDKGDPHTSPSTTDVPFIVTPPVSRIDPAKSQTLRIVYTGEPLPPDRESVFWLNVLEIPPVASGDAADASHLQLAFRSRIKLFYRPEKLKGNPHDAPSQLTWRLTSNQGHPAIEVHNPVAYDVSLASVHVVDIDGNSMASFEGGAMVEPGQTKILPLTGSPSSSPSAKVRYEAINDYGGAVKGEAALR